MVKEKRTARSRTPAKTGGRSMAKRRNRKISAKKNRNAVNGSHYEDADALEIVTLENAVYMGMKNDLAFIVDTGLFLYEHQSTYNPNMPLRDLFYISGEYQKFVDNRSLYSSSLQKIPAPNFIVFYNGTEKKEDSWVNYLSESYENLTGAPNLELKVITLNINEGHNCRLMEQCRILKEYAQYVAKVREYAGNTDLDTAVEQAVNDCIQNGILAEFLRKNKSEVIAMSIFEYDKEEEERKLRKAEYEAGREEGIKEGELQKARKTAIMLNQMNFPAKKIAEVLQVKEDVIEEWIRESL